MLNLEKEGFIDNIVLKRSFQIASMSVKNLVRNKLARQNIFFALLIHFPFLLFWLTLIIIYILILSSYYYYHYCFYYFIIITLFYCYYSHHYYCSQHYQCYLFYFISFCFLLFILLWLLSVCCLWRVYVLSFFCFFPFSC